MSILRRFLLFPREDNKLAKNSDRPTSAAVLTSREDGLTSGEHAYAELARTMSRLLIR